MLTSLPIQNIADTLSANPQLVDKFLQDGGYNYAEELKAPDFNLLQWIMDQISDLLSKLFSDVGGSNAKSFIFYVIGFLFIAFIIFLWWRFGRGIFRKAGKVKDDIEPEEDNIYGIDFEKELKKAIQVQNYYQAIRVVYLQQLRTLADTGKISWQLYKTPTQYTYEFKNTAFNSMTLCFMRVRYGNYEATEQSVNDMRAWQQQITEGGLGHE